MAPLTPVPLMPVIAGVSARPGELSPPPRLRIALFASSRMQPGAIVDALADMAASDFAEIVLIAVSQRPAPVLPWYWRICRACDQFVFSRESASSVLTDLLPRLPSVRTLTLPEYLAGPVVVNIWQAEIAALRLDAILALGDFEHQMLKGLARFGVWHFGFGAQPERLAGLEGFREVADGQSITPSRLTALLANGRETLLYESRSRTTPFSMMRNRDKLLRRTARFPGRVLKELHRTGTAGVEAPARSLLQQPAQAPSADLEVMRSLARIGERMMGRSLEKLLCVDQWFLAYRFSKGDDEAPMQGKFTCLMPPKDRFWADPFPLQRDGRHFIFFEELIFAENKAHIAVVEVGRNGVCSKPQRVLERPYHLSYPCLIEAEGQLLMVPETGQNGTVELYRCLHFPDRWVLEKVLLRVPHCVDATLHQADGKWWMFVNVGTDDADVHDELHLYYADSLDSEWQAHRLNPIKSDVRSARPAGHLYARNGQCYRPAQMGAPIYGSGISINRVLKLSPDEYLEQEVERFVAPNADGILGVHTFNRAGSLSVIDGFARRRRWGQKPIEFFEPARMGPDSGPDSRPDSRPDSGPDSESDFGADAGSAPGADPAPNLAQGVARNG